MVREGGARSRGGVGQRQRPAAAARPCTSLSHHPIHRNSPPPLSPAGLPLGEHVSPRLVRSLEVAYTAVAAAMPTADVVPLVPAAGWNEDAVAALSGLRAVVASDEAGRGAADTLLGGRPAGAAPVQVLPGVAGQSEAAARVSEAATKSSCDRAGEGAGAPPLSSTPSAPVLPPDVTTHPYAQAAVGGTFDHLHAGHRLLLAVSALATGGSLFVGVTGDKLLAAKAHAGVLQPYGQREAKAVAFVRAVRPGLGVTTGALLDPAAPTAAETDLRMQALIVSRETLGGGEAINAGRARRGYPPLDLVVIGLVAPGGGAKVSSTDLRAAAEARRRG